MEKLQEPITPCQLFGEQQLEVGRWEDGNAVYLTDYGGPILNSDEEQTAAAAAAAVALRFQPQPQQQQPFFTYDHHQKLQHQEVDKAAPNCCTGGAFYSSTILPCLEDDNNKMPFLQMLQSSSGLCYNPQQQIFNLDHFHQHQGFLQLLLELQEQEKKQQQHHHLSPPPEVVNHHHQHHYSYQAHDDYPSVVTTPTPKSTNLLVSNGNHELVESCVTDEIMMELYSSTSPAKSSETTTTANKERQQMVKNPPPCRRDENLLSSSGGCEQVKEEQEKGCLGRVRRTTSSSQCEMGKPPLVKERKKRKRSRPSKNKEEMESQRMTHIAVERNRRKQMNDHLNCLRSMMPPSYIQRGDQASIIGGAIDFVKELEQLSQSLQAQKRMRLYQHQQISEEQPINNTSGGGRDFSIPTSSSSTTSASPPSSSTATTTQYHDPKSTPCTRVNEDDDDGSFRDVVKGEGQDTNNNNNNDNVIRLLSNNVNDVDRSTADDLLPWRRMEGDDDQVMTVVENSRSSPGEADVSVVVIHNHVNLKVQCTRRNGQLVKAILALEDVRLTVLHLNVTSLQSFVHYSFNLKVEDDCELRSAEEIAAAVHHIFNLINS